MPPLVSGQSIVLDGVAVVLVGLVVGGLALHVAGSLVAGVHDPAQALVTALVGSLTWALFAWIPILGGLLALVAWTGVVARQYPGGWLRAVAIGLVAWVAAVVVLTLLGVVGVDVTAIGVPGA